MVCEFVVFSRCNFKFYVFLLTQFVSIMSAAAAAAAGFTFACAKSTASSRNTLTTAATTTVRDDIFSGDLHSEIRLISKALLKQQTVWVTVSSQLARKPAK